MAKPEKSAPAPAPAPADAQGAAKPKNKKKLLLIVAGVLLLVAAGGAGWYFTKGSHHAEEAKAAPPAPPKFIPLEPFTVNLQSEGGSDQFLQIGITLKFTDPELEDKIKLHMPEIRSHLLFLLSSKHASELAPVDGKKKLVQEIIAGTNSVLGLSPSPAAKPAVHEDHTASAVGAASAVGTASAVSAASAAEASPEAGAEAASAPEETAPAAAHTDKKKSSGVLDVLFTSFIIQ